MLRVTTACTFSTSVGHLEVQKWPEPEVICTFWLANVLRATRACTFSTSQLPKVVRACGVLYSLTSKMCFAPKRRAIFHLSSGQLAPHPPPSWLCFSSVNIVGNFNSKLPSLISVKFSVACSLECFRVVLPLVLDGWWSIVFKKRRFWHWRMFWTKHVHYLGEHGWWIGTGCGIFDPARSGYSIALKSAKAQVG